MDLFSKVTRIFSSFFTHPEITCGQVLLMGIFRALLLSFSFALAVKLGLGLWNCGTQGPEARQWENLAGRHQFVAGYTHMFSVSTCVNL